MTIRDMHGSGCIQCKIRDQFYEDKKNFKESASYCGVISYINHFLLMRVSSDQPKEEFPQNGSHYKISNISYKQLQKEWTYRALVSKHLNKKNEHLREEKKNYPEPSIYQPEHASNLIIKKSDSSIETSPDDTVCSDNLETTKENVKVKYKCKLTKKSPPKEKVASKEPKIGTLKRKRWNLAKLKKPNESYEDDLFEEKKLKRVTLEDANNSDEDKITTPRWSVQISPRELSRSPSYEDCYSPNELQSIRKEAEEYQYRRNKRKKYMRISKKGRFISKKDDCDSPTEMKEEDPDTYKTLEEVRNKLKKLEKLDCESEEEDYYFTDGEDSDN